jgi:hypothetical protein
LPHFITKSSFSFLFAIIYHQVVLFLFLCHTSSPSLTGKLGDEVWQRERKRKTG